MNGLQKLKQRLNSIRVLARVNNFGYYCPKCSISKNVVTAGARTVDDELYHNIKYFIKCKVCNLTTPAYSNIDEANEAWENVCASVEDKMLISIYEHEKDK